MLWSTEKLIPFWNKAVDVDGRNCCLTFSWEHVCPICDQCSAFDCPDLLFGHIMATVKLSETIENRGHPTKEREKVRSSFIHERRKV